MTTHTATHSDPYQLYTREEAAEFLRINQAYLTILTNSNELHSIRIGRRRLYPRASIEAFIRGERGPRYDTPDVETNTPSLFEGRPNVADGDA